MESKSMEICRGFVQLHIHGTSGKTRLRGRNIRVHGYTLYSCGEILCVYSNGRFYLNMANKGKSAVFKKHRDQITNAVCAEDSDLALYFRNEDELKDALMDEDGFYFGDQFGECVNSTEAMVS